jgi:prophage tail gpP-like protein
LKTVIERTIASLGAAPGQVGSAEISVTDEVNPDLFNEAEDLISPEPGDNAFEFIEKWARKRQVLLTPNGDGNVVITRGSATRIDAFLIHRVNSDDNNVISWGVDYDLTTRFNRYKMPSQLNLVALILAGFTTTEAIVEQGGGGNVITDGNIREGRQMVIVPEANSSDSESRKRAKWEKNIRKARSRIYSAVVDGYRNQTGDLWRVNRLIRVDDVFAGIDSVMLVNSVIYGLTEDEGSTTDIALVNRDAYTLEPTTASEEDELGIGYILKALS